MKKALLFFLMTYCQISFSQDDKVIVNMLRGTWVKNTNSKDTITFPSRTKSDHSFQLTIGKNSKYGPAGFYNYTTLGTTMLVHWLPSGDSGSNAIPFYIDKTGTEIKIGNFYHATGEGNLMIFRKIK